MAVDPTAAWGRRARPPALPDKPCHICGGLFTPHRDMDINCSPRCAYISQMLLRDAAKQMGRNEAITHYGRLYDVPFQSLGRSRYRPLVLAIAAFCLENDTTTFTYRQIAAVCGFPLGAQALAGCAANVAAVRKTGKRVKIGNGKTLIEWEFHRAALE